MSTPRTTVARLVTLYDKTIDYLEGKLDAGTLTGTDLAELRKLLDAATILQLVKHNAAPASGAVPVADLPFPDCPDAQDFPEMRGIRP